LVTDFLTGRKGVFVLKTPYGNGLKKGYISLTPQVKAQKNTILG